jgi:hypothetical protein
VTGAVVDVETDVVVADPGFEPGAGAMTVAGGNVDWTSVFESTSTGDVSPFRATSRPPMMPITAAAASVNATTAPRRAPDRFAGRPDVGSGTPFGAWGGCHEPSSSWYQPCGGACGPPGPAPGCVSGGYQRPSEACHHPS